MDRRTFLHSHLGIPLVFGLSQLFTAAGRRPVTSRAAGDPRPPWLKAALAEMKRTRRPGLVLVVPEDDRHRRRLGQALFGLVHEDPYVDWQRLRQASPDASWEELAIHRDEALFAGRDLVHSAVLVCLDLKTASKLFGAEGDRLLLSPDGRTLARAPATPNRLEPGFARRLLDLVHGPRKERLARQVEDLRARLDADLDARVAGAIAVVAGRSPGRPEAAARTLEDALPAVAPWILLAHHRADAPGQGGAHDAAREREVARSRARLRDVLTRNNPLADGPLPYGTRAVRFAPAACGRYREVPPGAEVERPTVACGRAMPRPGSRRFLRFLK